MKCRAGYRGGETPRRFRLGDRWLEVEEVLDRWLIPDHRCFKVRGGDGDAHLLRHGTESQRWELLRYRRDRE